MGSQEGRGRNGGSTYTTALLLGSVGLLLLLLGLYGLLLADRAGRSPLSLGVIDGDLLIQLPAEELPADTLFISHQRRQYDGTMQLVIPAIDVDTVVGASTAPEALRLTPGLYEFAQMPGEAGGNVSIAGHRDIYNMVFYHLDKLSDGDLIYLIYDSTIHTYRYEATRTVQPSDWSVIKGQDRAMVTLTTCDPIGTTWRRMVVTGRQIDTDPYERDMLLPARVYRD